MKKSELENEINSYLETQEKWKEWYIEIDINNIVMRFINIQNRNTFFICADGDRLQRVKDIVNEKDLDELYDYLKKKYVDFFNYFKYLQEHHRQQSQLLYSIGLPIKDFFDKE